MPLKITGAKLVSDKKFVRAAVIIGAAAILLIFISSLSPASDSRTAVPAENTAKLEQQLEQRLEALLCEIDGVASPRVMLTLEQTSQTVYARDSRNSASQGAEGGSSQTSSETEIVIIGSGSEKAALTESTILPKVRGVAVICGGAQNVLTREKVVNTVASVLNISTARVYVTY